MATSLQWYTRIKKRHALTFTELYIYCTCQHNRNAHPHASQHQHTHLFTWECLVVIVWLAWMDLSQWNFVWLIAIIPTIYFNLSLSTHGQIQGGPSCVCVPITGQHGFDLKVAHCVLYVRIFKSRGFYFSSFGLCIWGQHSVTNMPLCSK